MPSVTRFRLVHQDPSSPGPVGGTVEQFSGGAPAPPPLSTTATYGTQGQATAPSIVPPSTDTVDVEVHNATGVSRHVNCPCPAITDVRVTVMDAKNVHGTVVLNMTGPSFNF
ncbi:MAG TPA: hypothetical protein VND21_02700 [Planctomycetota bacterium]|jgi:hypothetical protein|nr:hypothetical protein [Planctomycetota bacterium]